MTLTNIFTPFKKSFALMLDQRVPVKYKLIPLVTILYILSPVDIIPDVFLSLGEMVE